MSQSYKITPGFTRWLEIFRPTAAKVIADNQIDTLELNGDSYVIASIPLPPKTPGFDIRLDSDDCILVLRKHPDILEKGNYTQKSRAIKNSDYVIGNKLCVNIHLLKDPVLLEKYISNPRQLVEIIRKNGFYVCLKFTRGEEIVIDEDELIVDDGAWIEE